MAETKTADTKTAQTKSDDKTYQSVYAGSGTFIISKPKRNKKKTQQQRVRNPKRGMRK